MIIPPRPAFGWNGGQSLGFGHVRSFQTRAPLIFISLGSGIATDGLASGWYVILDILASQRAQRGEYARWHLLSNGLSGLYVSRALPREMLS